ncbi:MAG: hypothetical protein FD166_1582 [Bacteroidetes bacterium]|nr:MAG: hypothetical protein FD166_1582 [Bacteroidota bacterium]
MLSFKASPVFYFVIFQKFDVGLKIENQQPRYGHFHLF